MSVLQRMVIEFVMFVKRVNFTLVTDFKGNLKFPIPEKGDLLEKQVWKTIMESLRQLKGHRFSDIPPGRGVSFSLNFSISAERNGNS